MSDAGFADGFADGDGDVRVRPVAPRRAATAGAAAAAGRAAPRSRAAELAFTNLIHGTNQKPQPRRNPNLR